MQVIVTKNILFESGLQILEKVQLSDVLSLIFESIEIYIEESIYIEKQAWK